jgi:hypothetical protein
MRSRSNNLRVSGCGSHGAAFCAAPTAVPLVIGEEPWRERPRVARSKVAPRVFWGRSRHGSRCPTWSRQGGRVAGCFERTKRRRRSRAEPASGSLAGSWSAGRRARWQTWRRKVGKRASGRVLDRGAVIRQRNSERSGANHLRPRCLISSSRACIDSSVIGRPSPRASGASVSSSARSIPSCFSSRFSHSASASFTTRSCVCTDRTDRVR